MDLYILLLFIFILAYSLFINRFAHSAGPGMGRSREDGMITWWCDGRMRSSKGQGMKKRVDTQLAVRVP